MWFKFLGVHIPSNNTTTGPRPVKKTRMKRPSSLLVSLIDEDGANINISNQKMDVLNTCVNSKDKDQTSIYSAGKSDRTSHRPTSFSARLSKMISFSSSNSPVEGFKESEMQKSMVSAASETKGEGDDSSDSDSNDSDDDYFRRTHVPVMVEESTTEDDAKNALVTDV